MENSEKQISSLFTSLAIEQCVKELEDDREVSITETSCGQLLIKGGEEVQVIVRVVRGKDNWIGDFDVIRHIIK